MRRLGLLAGVAVIALTLASQANAATNTSVKMSFTEQTIANLKQGCPVLSFTDNGPTGFCGNGVVVPFGHANETIQFGQGIDCVATRVSPRVNYAR